MRIKEEDEEMNIRQIESNLYIAVACLMAATGMTKKEFTTVAGISEL